MKHGKKYTDGSKLIDRANLYDSTVQVRMLGLLYSQKVTLLKLLLKQVLMLSAMLTLFRRFRAVGWISM